MVYLFNILYKEKKAYFFTLFIEEMLDYLTFFYREKHSLFFNILYKEKAVLFLKLLKLKMLDFLTLNIEEAA